MSDAKTDEEQVEALKKWFEENGTSTLVTIVLVLVIIFGYRTWETQTRETAESASQIYEGLVQAFISQSPLDTISDENISTGKFLANQLKEDHTSSTYAHFAAMHLAKIAVEADDLATAADELEWVLDNGANERIAVIANLRLAKVKFGMGEYESALAQMARVEAGAHQSSYEELRGDILYAMDRKDEARLAYEIAVSLQTEPRPIARMKLDDLVLPREEIAAEGTSPDETSRDETSPDERGSTDQVSPAVEED